MLHEPERIGPYRIVAPLAEGGMGVVYRAEHVETGQPVALKTLRGLEPTDLDTLRREIHALGRIHHPGVVRILGDGVSGGVPWYAMELIGGRTLDTLWARAPGETEADGSRAVEESLRVLRRLCGTLGFLHGEGIVHRDLKPRNIIVREDGRPVLVDFGLFSRFGGAIGREALEVGGELLGTVHYMAPEQARGEYVDARADLYSLGCILYEAIAGQPPFTGTPLEVLSQHLETAPVAPSARVPGVPDRLDALILRLLAKDPRRRVGYAADVAAELAAILEEEDEAGPPPRPYLYRPSFAGRAEFLAELVGCLDRVDDQGGQCIFVVGESGAGKTRLAMEATRAAIRKGFTVVTGECQSLEGTEAGPQLGGAPFYPFRSLLQLMADHCRVRGRETTDRVLGRRGKVLAAYEPTLATLPGQQEQPDPVPLPAQTARTRVLADLREAITEFVRERPLVLVLDDLQWADELTLAFLASLGRVFYAATHLVLIGIYRSEEVTPALRQLSGTVPARVLELGRLDVGTVGVIVSDMLAIGPPPEPLVRFVARESEGNPFFVAEYLRAAVGAGLLDRGAPTGEWRPVVSGRAGDAGYESLPLPRTLRELVGRRIESLDPPAQAFVEAAAVLGREFELTLAAALIDLDERPRFEAVTQLLGRHVIEEVERGRYRFTHDKVREVAYEAMAPARGALLHGRAAATIESRHAREPDFAQRYAALAHHWTMSGVDDKALEYLGKAGEHALASGGHVDAQRLLSRALALDDRTGRPAGSLARARWLRMLGEACFGAGDIEGALRNSSEVLAHLGYRVPQSRAGWLAVLGAELVRQATHWVLPATVVRGRRKPQQAWLEPALASGHLSTSFYYVGDMLGATAALLRGANLAERAGSSLSKALSYAQLGYVTGAAGLHPLARAYFRRCYAHARASGHRGVLGFSLYLDSQYRLGRAEWDRCEQAGEESVRLLEGVGDRHQAEIARTIVAHARYYQGHIEEARERFQAILTSARARSNPQHIAWGLFLTGRSLLALGRASEAVTLLEEAHAALADKASLVLCDGSLASALVRTGQLERAAEVADALAHHLEEPLRYGAVVDGYAGAAAAYLTLWERDGRRRDSPHRTAALRVSAALRRFARLFALAEPAALRFGAWARWLDGSPAVAERGALRAVRSAQRRHMPYDEALAHGLLARLSAERANRDRHREEAVRLLVRLGCGFGPDGSTGSGRAGSAPLDEFRGVA